MGDMGELNMAKTLIIIDMQNDFITGGLGSEAAQNIVEPLCDYITNFNSNENIICTRDTHDWNYLNTLEGQNLPIEHCIQDTAGWCIDDRILKALREKRYNIINKNHFGTLEWKSISYMITSEIEICGVCTDICVISNAIILRTIFPEAKITVLSDLCAGTSEEHHKQALEIMYQCDIEVR